MQPIKTINDTLTNKLHQKEIEQGERFEFGKNWNRFLVLLNEDRIVKAEDSLKLMLNTKNMHGKTFLDIGSGSGLFSLAARRLGARVHSFDYDPASVACTKDIKRRYFNSSDKDWAVEEGSVLDSEYISSLGKFDVVYSWGVLHHTGQMWNALANAQIPVALGGKLFIAIYNNTGSQTARWHWIKKTYNRLPQFLRTPYTIAVIAPDEAKSILKSLITLQPKTYVNTWTRSELERGMGKWRDIVDWVGGYPYEVAHPDEIFDFYRALGFTLSKLKCSNVGLGCNEYVFERAVNS